MEATNTMFGNRIHARVAGSRQTLCGDRSFGRLNVQHDRPLVDQVSCRHCRKALKAAR